MRTHVPKSLKAIVAARASYCCEYCKSPVKFCGDLPTIDHIVPVTRGGLNDLNNLAYSCHSCNSFKRDYIKLTDEATGDTVPIFHPRLDSWIDHFMWSEDFLKILPRTVTGKLMIDLLKLNRSGVVNLRSALIALGGVHPPQVT